MVVKVVPDVFITTIIDNYREVLFTYNLYCKQETLPSLQMCSTDNIHVLYHLLLTLPALSAEFSGDIHA